MPILDKCGICGAAPAYFSPSRGIVVCREHRIADDIPISDGTLALMRHITGCADKKMLAFTVGDEAVYEELGSITESYVSTHADREFKSLAYFKSML